MELTYHTGGNPDTADTVDFESSYSSPVDWLRGEQMYTDILDCQSDWEHTTLGYEFGDSVLSAAASVSGIEYKVFKSMFLDYLIEQCPDFKAWLNSKYDSDWKEWEIENHLDQ